MYLICVTEESEAQLVLATVIVIAMLVGLGLTIWWFVPTTSSGTQDKNYF